MISIKIKPKLRIILTVFLSVLMIVCAIIIGNIDSVIDYDVSYVSNWDKGNSHIGNISRYHSEGYKLNDNYVRIGSLYWYSNNVVNAETDTELGELIGLYSYSIDDSDSPNYGEKASFWVYDIAAVLTKLRMNKNQLYCFLHDKYANDTTSLWETTNEFDPFLALSTKPRLFLSLSQEDYYPVYKESFIIFANDRIYEFNFSNDKYHGENGKDKFNLFYERCKSVIDDTDLVSYTLWEKAYEDYLKLSEKQDSERELWSIVLYIIVILCCMAIFLLNIEEIGNNNKQARILAFYVIGCFVIGVISMTIGALAYPQKSDTLGWLVCVFFPSVAMYCLMEKYLATKSNTAYYSSYLIPKWTIQTFSIDSEFKKRLLLIFLFYPLFTLVPLPVAGLFVLVYYILPVIVLLLAIWGSVWLIAWLKAGKALDSKTGIGQTDKARIYCRHCGKLIDADSDYCRYCGKRI